MLKLPDVPIVLPRATEAMFEEHGDEGEYQMIDDEEAGLATDLTSAPPPSPPPSPPSQSLPSGKPPSSDYVNAQRQVKAVATAQAANELIKQNESLKSQLSNFSCTKLVDMIKEKAKPVLTAIQIQLAQSQTVLIAAAVSTVAALAMAVAEVPPWLSAIITSVIITMATVMLWHLIATSIFDKVNGFVLTVRSVLCSLCARSSCRRSRRWSPNCRSRRAQ
eukprot:6207867-Pleurochrysis_carterae.AAC.4